MASALLRRTSLLPHSTRKQALLFTIRLPEPPSPDAPAPADRIRPAAGPERDLSIPPAHGLQTTAGALRSCAPARRVPIALRSRCALRRAPPRASHCADRKSKGNARWRTWALRSPAADPSRSQRRSEKTAASTDPADLPPAC